MSNPQDHPPTQAEPVKRLVLKINKPLAGAAPSLSASTVQPSSSVQVATHNSSHVPAPSAPQQFSALSVLSPNNVPQGSAVSHTQLTPHPTAHTNTQTTASTQSHTAHTPSTQPHIQSTPNLTTAHAPSASTLTTPQTPSHVPQSTAAPVHPSPVPPTAHSTAQTSQHVTGVPSSASNAGPQSSPAPKPMTLTVTSGGRTITIKPLAKPGAAPPTPLSAPTTPALTAPTATPASPALVTSPPVARPKFVLKTKLTFKLPRQVCVEEVEKLKQAEAPKPQLKLKIAFPAKERTVEDTATATRKRKALYDLEDESHDEDVDTPRRNKRARVDLDEQSEEQAATEHESEQDFANQPKLSMSEVMRHLLPELTARDANAYYRHEITEDVAPQYFEIIKQPMWFDKMALKLGNDEYPTLVSFQRDFELICKNAMEYNRASTPWHKEARRLLREGKQLIERWTKRLEPNDLALHLDAVNAAALAHTSRQRETRERERERERESESESHTAAKKSAYAEVGRVSDLVKRKFAGSQSNAPATVHHQAVPELNSGVMLPPRSSISAAQMFQATRQLKSPYPTAPVPLTPAPGAHYPPGLHSRAAHTTTPPSHQYAPLITSKASAQFLSPYVPNFVAFTSSTPTTSTHIVAPQIIKLPIHDVSYTSSLEHFVHSLDAVAQSRVRKFIAELRTGTVSTATPHGEAVQSSSSAARGPALTAANTLGSTPAELKSALQHAAQLGVDVSALSALLGKLDGDLPTAAPPLNAAAVAPKESLLSANQGALIKLQAMQEERGGDPTLVTPTEQQLVREVSDNLKSFLGESAVPMTE